MKTIKNKPKNFLIGFFFVVGIILLYLWAFSQGNADVFVREYTFPETAIFFAGVSFLLAAIVYFKGREGKKVRALIMILILSILLSWVGLLFLGVFVSLTISFYVFVKEMVKEKNSDTGPEKERGVSNEN